MSEHEHKMVKAGELYDREGDVVGEVFLCMVPRCSHRENRS